jgi:8-oxo-dGTP pyrophosphatase MutT (NUDIX family)
MVAPSEELNDALRKALRKLNQSPFPHIANPDGCEKRASVALVLRLRPTYHVQLANAKRSGNAVAEANPTSLEEFLSQTWEGDPEVLFIKRAGRAGDRWSGHTALPGGKRDPQDADDLAAAIRETKEEVGLDLTGEGCFHIGNLPQRVVTTAWGKRGLGNGSDLVYSIAEVFEQVDGSMPVHLRHDYDNDTASGSSTNRSRSRALGTVTSAAITVPSHLRVRRPFRTFLKTGRSGSSGYSTDSSRQDEVLSCAIDTFRKSLLVLYGWLHTWEH